MVIGFQNEVDAFYDEAEADLGLKLKNTSKRGYAENIDEVFGISDSDDDFISEESKKSKKKAQKEATRENYFYFFSLKLTYMIIIACCLRL